MKYITLIILLLNSGCGEQACDAMNAASDALAVQVAIMYYCDLAKTKAGMRELVAKTPACEKGVQVAGINESNPMCGLLSQVAAVAGDELSKDKWGCTAGLNSFNAALSEVCK